MVDYSLAVNEQQLDTSRHRQVTDTSAPVIQKKKRKHTRFKGAVSRNCMFKV